MNERQDRRRNERQDRRRNERKDEGAYKGEYRVKHKRAFVLPGPFLPEPSFPHVLFPPRPLSQSPIAPTLL